MKIKGFLIVCLSLLCMAWQSAPDPCKLKGQVFVTEHPGRADLYVYVVDYETQAELMVFTEDNPLYANQAGHWFYTDTEAFADFTIFFTDSPGAADLRIYYTDIPSFAGCR